MGSQFDVCSQQMWILRVNNRKCLHFSSLPCFSSPSHPPPLCRSSLWVTPTEPLCPSNPGGCLGRRCSRWWRSPGGGRWGTVRLCRWGSICCWTLRTGWQDCSVRWFYVLFHTNKKSELVSKRKYHRSVMLCRVMSPRFYQVFTKLFGPQVKWSYRIYLMSTMIFDPWPFYQYHSSVIEWFQVLKAQRKCSERKKAKGVCKLVLHYHVHHHHHPADDDTQ